MLEFEERFASEEACHAYLVQQRWPEGFRCPRCGHGEAWKLSERRLLECRACGHQASVTAGTVFNDSHLPLWKWFLATYLICDSKKGISANQLKRMIGVSYKTAWYLCHRIREAMKCD